MTDVSLREYVDSRFASEAKAVSTALTAAEKAVNAALSAAKEAVTKAEMASDKRFEAVNEFRATLADNARLMMPRLEAEQIAGRMQANIDALTQRLNARENQGKGLQQGWLIFVAANGVIISIISLAIIFFRSH